MIMQYKDMHEVPASILLVSLLIPKENNIAIDK